MSALDIPAMLSILANQWCFRTQDSMLSPEEKIQHDRSANCLLSKYPVKNIQSSKPHTLTQLNKNYFF